MSCYIEGAVVFHSQEGSKKYFWGDYMLRGQEERKYSIRKYSIGVVSVLAATMFVVSSHEAQASEKTSTNAAAQKKH